MDEAEAGAKGVRKPDFGGTPRKEAVIIQRARPE